MFNTCLKHMLNKCVKYICKTCDLLNMCLTYCGFIRRTTPILSIFTNGTGDLIRPVWTNNAALKLYNEILFIGFLPSDHVQYLSGKG